MHSRAQSETEGITQFNNRGQITSQKQQRPCAERQRNIWANRSECKDGEKEIKVAGEVWCICKIGRDEGKRKCLVNLFSLGFRRVSFLLYTQRIVWIKT